MASSETKLRACFLRLEWHDKKFLSKFEGHIQFSGFADESFVSSPSNYATIQITCVRLHLAVTTNINRFPFKKVNKSRYANDSMQSECGLLSFKRRIELMWLRHIPSTERERKTWSCLVFESSSHSHLINRPHDMLNAVDRSDSFYFYFFRIYEQQFERMQSQ